MAMQKCSPSSTASTFLALARERDDQRQIEWALRVLSFDEPDLDQRRRLLQECERLNREPRLGHLPARYGALRRGTVRGGTRHVRAGGCDLHRAWKALG